MATVPTISVAMATYNGAQYIREQLESIAAQTSVPDEVVIGDDGSSDKTVAIIQEFATRAPFPVRLQQNSNRLGYGENFLRIAARCRAEWVSFCDQDDVWFPQKLEQVRKAIGRGPRDLALIVHQAEVVDERLVSLGRQLIDEIEEQVVPRRGHKCLWFAYGMAVTVRSDIFREFDWSARPPDRFYAPQKMAHDVWVALMANALGSSRFVPTPLMFYRRHKNAATRNFTGDPGSPSNPFSLDRSAADKFAWDSTIHKEISQYLRELAQTCAEFHRSALLEHSEDFRLRSVILRNRERLEREQRIVKRARALVDNIQVGAYNRANNFGFGLRSLGKDLAKLSGLL